MPATDSVNKQVCDYKAGLGNVIKLHEQDRDTVHAASGAGTAAPIATTPASAPTTWGASAMGSGGDAGYAVAVGSKCGYSLPPSKTARSYSVWNGSTYLWAANLDSSLTSNAEAVPIDVTPRTRHKET